MSDTPHEGEDMKLSIDKTSDALYLKLEEAVPNESEEVSPGIVLDFDGSGRVIAIEVLNVSQRGDKIDLKSVVLENA